MVGDGPGPRREVSSATRRLAPGKFQVLGWVSIHEAVPTRSQPFSAFHHKAFCL